jgi:SAM-dependent methyltransferase
LTQGPFSKKRRVKRSHEKELMDLPGNPKELLEEDLRNLRVINRYLGGYRGVMMGLKQLVEKQSLPEFSLLDVGTGSGDIPAAIARWGRRRGVGVKIVGLEPEPVTARLAATLTNPSFIPVLQKGKEGDFRRCGILVVRGDGLTPPFRPASFDFVLASQLLHHFSEDKIVTVLRVWAQLARRAIIISDLVRHPVAYHGIRLITKICTRNIMTLTDGPLSVRRAFTLAEWGELFRRADVGRVEIFSLFPFRVAALISLQSKS